MCKRGPYKLKEVADARIFELLAQGLVYKQIATELGVTKKAIEIRLASMRKKYNCNTTVQMVVQHYKHD